MQQLGHDIDQDEPRSYRIPHVGSPIASSPPGTRTGSTLGTFNMLLSICLQLMNVKSSPVRGMGSIQ